jgi:pyruvate/2-oxoglutarate dehydrogenase complex dihydrolipoamide acyltransferase (E2) component
MSSCSPNKKEKERRSKLRVMKSRVSQVTQAVKKKKKMKNSNSSIKLKTVDSINIVISRALPRGVTQRPSIWTIIKLIAL